MKTILIPVDLSPQSYHTAHFGLELAGKLGMRVLLLHVVPPSFSAPILNIPLVEMDTGKSSLYAQLTTDLQAFKDELIAYRRQEGLDGVEISSRTVVGQPAESILAVSRAEHPAFVVMGTVGASNAWHKMVGSVSSAVARQITHPLWILPGAVRLDSLRKFVYFSELEGKEVGCIDQVVDLGDRLQAKLSVVHVASGDEEDFLEAEAITEIFEFCYANKRVTFKNLMYDTVGEGMEAYIQSHQPDAVVLAHRKRGMIEKFFHRSTIRQLALTTRRPLLIIQKRT